MLWAPIHSKLVRFNSSLQVTLSLSAVTGRYKLYYPCQLLQFITSYIILVSCYSSLQVTLSLFAVTGCYKLLSLSAVTGPYKLHFPCQL